jgi:YD repeat-containing protein
VWLKSQTVEGLSAKTVLYAYDLTGKVTRVIYPDGSEARYPYDPAGRVSKVTDAAGNPYARYTYALGLFLRQ